MPRLALLAVLALALAACGVDGPPQPPSGITVTGTAEMGIARNGS